MVGGAQQTPAPAVVTPAFDFSGRFLRQLQLPHRLRAPRRASAERAPTSSALDRAYLTFRMPAGDNAAIRVTTDIFQNTNAATNALLPGLGRSAEVRLRPVHGAPRTSSARDRASSAESACCTTSSSTTRRAIGRATSGRSRTERKVLLVGRRRRRGSDDARRQVGRGLRHGHDSGSRATRRVESDRFKDVALRLSLTPFGESRQRSARFCKSFAITPWFYKGSVGSAFQSGGVGAGRSGNERRNHRRPARAIAAGIFTGTHASAASLPALSRRNARTRARLGGTPSRARASSRLDGRVVDGFFIAAPRRARSTRAKQVALQHRRPLRPFHAETDRSPAAGSRRLCRNDARLQLRRARRVVGRLAA